MWHYQHWRSFPAMCVGGQLRSFSDNVRQGWHWVPTRHIPQRESKDTGYCDVNGTLYLCYRHWTISVFPGRISTDSQYHSAGKV